MGGRIFSKAATLAIAFLTLLVGTQAQTEERKIEVGGQFSVLRFSVGGDGLPTITGNDKETDYGFGGRFGYNFNKQIGFDSEVNFFPRDREFEGGRKTQLLAGIKAGGRSDKFGVFAKARPGILHLTAGDYRLIPGGGCVAVFPAPLGCFESKGKTNFAFDVGGIVEFYPSERSIVRFDAGDTIVRYGARNFPSLITGPPGPIRLVIFSIPSETVHNFQASVGFGFRF